VTTPHPDSCHPGAMCFAIERFSKLREKYYCRLGCSLAKFTYISKKPAVILPACTEIGQCHLAGQVDKFRGHKDGKPSSHGRRNGNITSNEYI
jgi:hypothetical protein